MESIKLNLGCGAVRPPGWVNTDSSLNANLQRIPLLKSLVTSFFKTVKYDSSNFVYMNLNSRWKYAAESVDVVYASHLFEHLTLQASDLMLKESFRSLKQGGVIRIVVPDMYKICKHYVTELENGNTKASDYVMWAINMHREGQYKNLNFLKKLFFEWQGYPHQHKFMYDEYSLKAKMEGAGFKDILSLDYGKSKYLSEQIRDVEGSTESYLSVYLEGRKPFINI